ncbi:MAG: hypothetical protein MOGMAGMI_02537 [Candidatus Omnitrophica bacterium]|nr:hypothetical protein [Candidatus Omnitrophota bacterium]
MDATQFPMHFWKRIKKIADGQAGTDEMQHLYNDLKEVGETLDACASLADEFEPEDLENAISLATSMLEKYQ